MPTIKNCHSPAGMEFSDYGHDHIYLVDCPKCKFGTLDFDEAGGAQCADCSAHFTPSDLLRLGIKPKPSQ